MRQAHSVTPIGALEMLENSGTLELTLETVNANRDSNGIGNLNADGRARGIKDAGFTANTEGAGESQGENPGGDASGKTDAG